MTLSDRIFIMENGRIVQSGEPEEIYRSPANEFVARFIGSYNVFTREQWQRLVSRPGREAASYAVRPEAIQVFAGDSDSFWREQEGWIVSGTVTDKTLKGNVIRLQVEANGLTLHVDQLNAARQQEVRRGMNVHLFIPETECVLL
jgi:putative spermidine/putrescine transport system ATP-binding protein